MARKALITGITGQDGSYLAEFLLKKGFDARSTGRGVSPGRSMRFFVLRRGMSLAEHFAGAGEIEAGMRTDFAQQSRHVRLKKLFASLNLKLRGYYNYYGVSGNSDRLREFFNEARGTLWKWLNRRSQRRKEHVVQDPALYRPTDVSLLQGDTAKAAKRFGWKYSRTFTSLVEKMVEWDLRRYRGELRD